MHPEMLALVTPRVLDIRQYMQAAMSQEDAP